MPALSISPLRRRGLPNRRVPRPTPAPAPIQEWEWTVVEMGRRQDNGSSSDSGSGGSSSASSGGASDSSTSASSSTSSSSSSSESSPNPPGGSSDARSVSSSSSSTTTTTTTSDVHTSSDDVSSSTSTSSGNPPPSSSNPSPTPTPSPGSSSSDSGSASSPTPTPTPTTDSGGGSSPSGTGSDSAPGGSGTGSGSNPTGTGSRSSGSGSGTGSTGSGRSSGSLTRSSVVTRVLSETTHTVIPVVTESSMPVVVTNSLGQQSTITSLVGVTLSSTVQTVNVITSTGAALHHGKTASEAFFHNKGAVAGVFVVVGLAVAAILLGFAFLYVRRKRARELQEDLRVAAGGAGAGGAGVNRVGEDDDDDLYHSGSRSVHTGGSSWGAAGQDGGSNHTNTPLMGQYHPSNGSGGLGVLAAAQGYQPGHGHSNSLGGGAVAPLMGGAAAAGAGAGMYAAYNGMHGADTSSRALDRDSGGSYYGDTPHNSMGYAHPPGDDKAPGDYDPHWAEFVASGVPMVYGDPEADAQARASGDSGLGLKEARYRDSEDDTPTSEGDEAIPVDQRLDPRTALLGLHEQQSVRSLRDHEDYSRKILKVANPEDEDE